MFRLHHRPTLPLSLALLLGLGSAAAQTPQNRRPDCSGPEHRQFDFWVGNWNVTVGGKQAGTNDVTLILGKCVVQEHWVGAKGLTGQSFNFYNRDDGRWHQLWVDDVGSALDLAGNYADGKMVLSGTTAGKDGKQVLQRITWFDNRVEGTVRQLWESSNDNGQTWQVAFDGVYRKTR